MGHVTQVGAGAQNRVIQPKGADLAAPAGGHSGLIWYIRALELGSGVFRIVPLLSQNPID